MNKRILLVELCLLLGFSSLVMHFFKIQVVDGKKWAKLAARQHEYIVKVPFKRGSFYSNTEIQKSHPPSQVAFVHDVSMYHLHLDPLSINPIYFDEIASSLSEFIKVDPHDILAHLAKKSRSRRVSKWLDVRERKHILNWWKSFAKAHKIPSNALFFVTDYQRCYPFGKLLGQLLHTIQEQKNEKTSEAIPTGGLEAHFHSLLEGKVGKRKLKRSPRHSIENDQVLEPPLDGADIYLTINHHIQAICEEEIEKGVVAAKAKGAWCLMMDPQTGEILAYAQYPFFDPSCYKSYFNDPDRIEDTKAKGINDAFEIGSIMKPLVLSLALLGNEELREKKQPPLFDPEEAIDTTKGLFPGRTRPLKDPSFYKMMNMNMTLQRSSNIYMAQIMDRILAKLGASWYREKLSEVFGFGKVTGIEFPAEALGLVPTPGKVLPSGSLEWSLATPYSLALGHNILCTPIQMTAAFCSLANGGYQVKPTLVKKIERKKSNGEIELIENTKLLEKKRVLPQKVCSRVIEGMKYSTKPSGTASLADVFGFSEAGKTGTAEKIVNGAYSKKSHLSSFIGFAPAQVDFSVMPRLVLLVCVDEPAHLFLEGGIKNHAAGRCAAPIFREITRRTLEYLGVEPDDPHGYPVQDPRFDPQKADWYNEVKQIKLLFEQWNRRR